MSVTAFLIKNQAYSNIFKKLILIFLIIFVEVSTLISIKTHANNEDKNCTS